MTTFNSSNYTPWKQEPGATPRERENFRLTLAALFGLLVCVLVIGAAVLIRHNNRTITFPQPKWSSFKPQDGGDLGALEIADYVSRYYRVSGTQQLTVVTPISTASLNESTGTFTGPGLDVAVSSTGDQNGLTPLPGGTVAYDLCGAGASTVRWG